MGLLKWRVWDRLDDLDRQTGVRRPWTEASVARTQRFLWFLTAFVVLGSVIAFLSGDWAWAVTLLVLGLASVFTNRITIRNLRARAAL